MYGSFFVRIYIGKWYKVFCFLIVFKYFLFVIGFFRFGIEDVNISFNNNIISFKEIFCICWIVVDIF